MTEDCLSIQEKIRAYYGNITGEHDRYRSWEHCHQYFHNTPLEVIKADRNHAALQLGFYLASWGMYRGRSFLLQYSSTIHLGVIDRLVEPKFAVLWEQEFGACSNDLELVSLIIDATVAIRDAYKPFVAESRQATDTLVTKIILGTFGCLPAYDRYFINGFRSAGFKNPHLNAMTIEQLLNFCRNNRHCLCEEQERIESSNGMRYPLMKLVDMYFWQIGYERGMVNDVEMTE